MNILSDALRYVFFPEADRCPLCGREGARDICESCSAKLAVLQAYGCREDGGIFAYHHEGLARKAVLDLKFNNKRFLARFMAEALAPLVPDGIEIVTAVPLYVSRRRQRGYNQSALIGRELSRFIDIPYAETLIRTRKTREQALIKLPEQRRKNVEGAFKVINASQVEGKSILLIDDVITTGATVDECSKALKKENAACITAISFTSPQ